MPKLKPFRHRIAPLIKSQRGFTLIELVVTTAIIGIVAVPVAYMISRSLNMAVKTDTAFKTQEDIRSAFDMLERDLSEATQITEAQPEEIVFLLDSYRMPGYINNSLARNADDDNDASDFMDPNEEIHMHGNDLMDDDDNADGRIDVQVRVRRVDGGRTLVEEFNYNEAGWQPRTLLTNVSTFQLTYYGSKAETESAPILDRNGNGTIDDFEIDAAKDADGVMFDTVPERLCIRTIHIRIGQDKNWDSKEDFNLETEISPPLIPLKRLP